MSTQKGADWLLFVVLALIWGSSFILMKKGAEQLDGWQIAAVRIFSAGLVFLPFALRHVRQLPRRKVPIVVLTGLLGNLLPAFLFSLAIEHKVPSSMAGILNSLTPLFVIVMGVLFFGVKTQRKKVVGVIIGFIGLFLLSVTKGPVSFSEIGFTLLILLATIFYGLNVNIVGSYLKGLDPVKMASVSLAFLTVPTALVLFLHPPDWQQPAVRTSIWASVILGIMGSAMATLLFYMLIKRAGGLFASLVTYAIPVVAIAWGLIYGEQVGPVQFGCLAIILSGVYVANR